MDIQKYPNSRYFFQANNIPILDPTGGDLAMVPVKHQPEDAATLWLSKLGTASSVDVPKISWEDILKRTFAVPKLQKVDTTVQFSGKELVGHTFVQIHNLSERIPLPPYFDQRVAASFLGNVGGTSCSAEPWTIILKPNSSEIKVTPTESWCSRNPQIFNDLLLVAMDLPKTPPTKTRWCDQWEKHNLKHIQAAKKRCVTASSPSSAASLTRGVAQLW